MLPNSKRLSAAWPDLNSGFTFRDFIKSKHAGLAILQFYTTVHPASGTPEEWTARIAGGQVAVNDTPVVDASRVLRVGDVLCYTRLPWREPESPSHVDVLFEDEHMVALAKPPGLQVLPAAMFHERTVLTLLQRHYGGGAASASAAAAPLVAAPAAEAAVQQPAAQPPQGAETCGALVTQSARQPGRRPGGDGAEVRGSGGGGASPGRLLAVPAPVHRLGRGTSGLLLCARTPEARRRLTELMTCKTASAAADAAAAAAAAADVAADAARGAEAAPAAGPVAAASAARAAGAATAAATAAAAASVGTATDQAAAETADGSGGKAEACASSEPAEGCAPTEAVPAPQRAAPVDAAPLAAPPAGGQPAPAGTPRSSGAGAGEAGLPLRKLYRALVQGLVRADQGRVDVPIGPIHHPGVDGGLFAASPDGKPAASLWRVLERRHHTRPPALAPAATPAPAADSLPERPHHHPPALAPALAPTPLPAPAADSLPERPHHRPPPALAPAPTPLPPPAAQPFPERPQACHAPGPGPQPQHASCLRCAWSSSSGSSGTPGPATGEADTSLCGVGPPPCAPCPRGEGRSAASGEGADAAAAEAVEAAAANAADAGAMSAAAPLEDEAEGATLMEVEILTGRPHQIRIHMAAMGHPLVGDPLYGVGGVPRAGLDAAALLDGEDAGAAAAAKDASPGSFGRPGDCGYHLHSLELHLPHPATGERLVLRAPPPALLSTAAERALADAAEAGRGA